MGKVLNTTQAANYLGLTEEELIRSKNRGLPPGSLGFVDAGVLVWRKDDLLPPPKARLIAAGPGKSLLECSVCGFQAKSKGGLTTHKRIH